MGNIALNFAANHQQFIQGIIVGAIVSNPGICALIIFNALTRIPGVGPWIAKNPDKAKAWADGFDKRINELVDKYAKDNQETAPKP